MLSLSWRLHDSALPLLLPQIDIGLRYSTRRNPIFGPIRSSSPSLQEIERSPSSSPSDVNLGEKVSASAPFPPIKAAKRVVLVRHGQSTWNEEGRIQGSSDFSVLTQKGESQAETSRQMLIDDSFDVCFTSPLIRSKRTAEIIWDGRGEEMIPEPELREIDLYSFQGLLKHEGKERFGEAYRKWQTDAPNFNIDGHYPVRELWARARDCWNKILIHEGKAVLVVAHNAVNQALVAAAIGLSAEYFRVLLQSNCGVSVLDFTPRLDGGSPHICLNRLNQTPNSPVASGSSGGRKTSMRIILACHGSTQINTESDLANLGNGPMNMLGIIQSQKTAELLLDLKLSSIICSPQIASVETAITISKVQEAADCLGVDCVPRYVEMKQLQELEVEPILPLSNEARIRKLSLQPICHDHTLLLLDTRVGKTWEVLFLEVFDRMEEKNLVSWMVMISGHEAMESGMAGHGLDTDKERAALFSKDYALFSIIENMMGAAWRNISLCASFYAMEGREHSTVTELISKNCDCKTV
ncbi:hypothetical protein Sjap_001255 [Stephania japonica]|uniref:2-carboxy-D-arabinitol-1-phosphatase n=1 Tax=Stephania japonica TaxID=461633 RepID=A0AAP0PT54_9MAGN